MAVYKRQYKGYSGRITPAWSRFFILTRNGWTRLFQSRFIAIYLAGCGFFPLLCAAYIYLRHNPTFMALLRVRNNVLPIDGSFFYYICVVQGSLAFLLTAFVGPSMVSPDLVNGAMPLYLCRPFSRAEYVAGKLILLLYILALITWIPGLILFIVQGTEEGFDWVSANLWIAEGLVIGLFVWTLVLSLLALAMSAWVKWRIAAGALVLGVFFGGAGFGAAINNVMRTNYGTLLDLNQVAHVVWADLLRYDSNADISVGQAWLALTAAALICGWLLARRVRAFEVIR